MFRIRKKFKFEGAHILTSSYSEECRECIHGHSYVVEVFIQAESLNGDGMVIDFKMLKEKVNVLISRWDHSFVIHNNDPRQNVYHLADIIAPFNPTAENMAKHFYDTIRSLGVEGLYKVRIHETDTGWAEYEPTENTPCLK